MILAFAVAKPLRRPPESAPRVGTPLRGSVSAGTYAEGTLSLGKDVTPAEAARPLFLIVRTPAGGPPIAVKKVVSPAFPLTFTVTNDNNMVGADFYEGDITFVARLDADGMAGPRQPEDIETSVQIKSGGSRQVQLVLAQ